jgi:TetR/AcrR family transcriptional regulator, transcriptional repressor for nem operon
MRVSRQILAEHRAAILEQAGRLFRRRGIGAVSVADLTRAAGLTHGAFYGHYPSKSALAAETCAHSLADGAARWRRRADRARAEQRNAVDAIIDAYLTEEHRDAPEDGCVLAALGSEVARSDAALRNALQNGVEALIAALDDEIGRERPELDAAARSHAALAVLSALTGGLILARSLASSPQRSQAALAAAATAARGAAHQS